MPSPITLGSFYDSAEAAFEAREIFGEHRRRAFPWFFKGTRFVFVGPPRINGPHRSGLCLKYFYGLLVLIRKFFPWHSICIHTSSDVLGDTNVRGSSRYSFLDGK